MISESNFVRLKQISKVVIEVEKQVYEDIPGFESLRIVFKNKSPLHFPQLKIFIYHFLFIFFNIFFDQFLLFVIQFEL